MTPNTINAAHDDLRDLYISRVIKAPTEVVWRAWAEVELFEKWWTPKPVVTKVSQMRLEAGGVFGTDIVMPNGDAHPSVGCFLQVIPNQQIIFTDALSGGFRPTKTAFMTVIIDFNPHPEGCEYAVRVMHQSEEDKHRHKEMGFDEGWATTIAQLADLVEAL